ncbi:MAG TPA: hypothetical protein VJM34_02735, partial [Novosphingobium sp.]|nr:hypothetical protein [Novosphingobium sp.]
PDALGGLAGRALGGAANAAIARAQANARQAAGTPVEGGQGTVGARVEGIIVNQDAIHSAGDRLLGRDAAISLYGDARTAALLGANPASTAMLARRDALVSQALAADMSIQTGIRSDFQSELVDRAYPAVPDQAISYSEMRGKEAYFAGLIEAAGSNPTMVEMADFADMRGRLVAERVRLDEAYASADRQIAQIGRAGFAPFDIASGAINIGSGNGELRDYLAVGGAIPAGKMLGAFGVAVGIEAKSFTSFSALKRYLGSPGTGNQWHHIVEQTPGNLKAFGAETIHSIDNVVAVSKDMHIGKGTISAYYSGKDFFTNGQTIRQWVSTQSFQAQRQFGLDVIKRFGQ